MNETKIEWTHFPGYDKGMSWNPIRAVTTETTGPRKKGWACIHAGEGCRFCYAEATNKWRGTGLSYTAQDKDKFELYLDEKALLAPLKMKEKVCFFTNSMTDLFGLDFGVTEEMLAKVYAVMALTPQHLYLNLTKRSKARRKWLSSYDVSDVVRSGIQAIGHQVPMYYWPLPNVMEGSSIACQKDLHQLDDLVETPAWMRFVSYEPAIEQIDYDRWLWKSTPRSLTSDGAGWDKHKANLLHWIIVGGESGPNARPFDIQWARDTIRQCREAGVPVFVKQLGGKVLFDHRDTQRAAGMNHWTSSKMEVQLKHPKGGDMSEWPEDIRVREFPKVTP